MPLRGHVLRLVVVETRGTLRRRDRGSGCGPAVFWFRRRETHVTGTHVASAHQQIHQYAVGRPLFGCLLLLAPFPRRLGRARVRTDPLHATDGRRPAHVLQFVIVCGRISRQSTITFTPQGKIEDLYSCGPLVPCLLPIYVTTVIE